MSIFHQINTEILLTLVIFDFLFSVKETILFLIVSRSRDMVEAFCDLNEEQKLHISHDSTNGHNCERN